MTRYDNRLSGMPVENLQKNTQAPGARALHPVLLVEDNEDEVFLLTRKLKAMGVHNEIVVVPSGRAGIEYLGGVLTAPNFCAKALPCLVLTDLRGPVENNIELIRWCRTKPELQALHIIVLTGSEDPADRNQALAAGANSYVGKSVPISLPKDIVGMAEGC